MAELDARSGVARPRESVPFRSVAKGYTIFRDGDLLAAKITPCWENGKIGQAELDDAIGAGSTEFHVLRPGPDVDPRYLLHFLRQPHVVAAGALRMTGSAGHRRVPSAFIEALPLPLPSLAEQRRLSSILDTAEATLRRRYRVLDLLDQLDSAIFGQVVAGVSDTRTLRQMGVDFVSGKNVLGDGKDNHPVNRVIKVSAVSSGTFLAAESKSMPADYVPPPSHRIGRGDMLFGRASGSLDLLGATAVVDHAPDDLYLPDKVWRLVVEPESTIMSRYVLGVLRSPSARAFIRHNASGAAGVRNIPKTRLLELRAPLPPPTTRAQYSERVSAVDGQRRRVRAALARDVELFDSLRARAFRQEL